ncbi:MAG: hypothetical protein ACE5K0_08915 [Candidatus Methanofastidiosia archaeon]
MVNERDLLKELYRKHKLDRYYTPFDINKKTRTFSIPEKIDEILEELGKSTGLGKSGVIVIGALLLYALLKNKKV